MHPSKELICFCIESLQKQYKYSSYQDLVRSATDMAKLILRKP